MRQVRIVMVGDVDAGKSTILGRMLVDLGQVTPARLAELENSSTKRGVPIEYSFLLDAFQLERDQAITLDISRIWLRMPERDYVFVDAPGHRELIRNLLTGASEVDAAILVVAADEGITMQTRRQALFLQWFGFKELLVAINKLDLAVDAETEFEKRKAEVRAFLDQLEIAPIDIVPIAARDGDNVALGSKRWTWWKGPTLLEALETLRPYVPHASGPLRFVVQDVYRRGTNRLVAGRVESGNLRVGERIVFWPLQTDAVVTAIHKWPKDVEEARAGEVIAISLDERVFVDRGAVASYAGDGPALGHAMQATVVWLGGDPAMAGEALRLRIGTREVPVTLQRIDEIIDPDSLLGKPGEALGKGDVAVVTLTSRELVAADDEIDETSIGRFVLMHGTDVVAGGRVRAIIGRPRSEGATDVIAQISSVHREERIVRNGHAGGVFWLTGLPSAGKSTVAMAVQRMLFDRGMHVYVLDGDTLRTTLNVDLGFSEEDRTENVRRTAAVAGVLADAGFVVISALISPFSHDRERARAAYPGGFYEIYISCDLKTAESRDVKGHYKRARLGEIQRFTGISSPYEVPDKPDLSLDTTRQSIGESAAALMEFIEEKTRRRVSVGS
ncbi:MAG TPA: adenylyl-sulfate kinase [Candidatus Baltobacteraceae bacterium]|nr:adenylyl-sulfate kinase [Candidatus Baltobacteraceae bacterium]